MLAELQPNFDKLVAAAKATDDNLVRLAGETLQGVVTTKASRRFLIDVDHKLADFRTSSHGAVAQFVKLSYLRSARQVNKQFKLRDEDNRYIDGLIRWAESEFHRMRDSVMRSGDRAARRAFLSQVGRTDTTFAPANEAFAQAMDHARRRGLVSVEDTVRQFLTTINDRAERAGHNATEVAA